MCLKTFENSTDAGRALSHSEECFHVQVNYDRRISHVLKQMASMDNNQFAVRVETARVEERKEMLRKIYF